MLKHATLILDWIWYDCMCMVCVFKHLNKVLEDETVTVYD